MSVYFIAQIQISDESVYQEYLDSTDEIFKNYKGRYLAVDDTPICLEGFCEEARIVIIEFPTKAGFKSWYFSDEYQEILKIRLRAAICNSILIEGK